MAEAEGLSQSAVSRIWRAFGVRPHIVETWKLSTDPQFATQVRDAVGIYLSPPENALVLAVDEKSQIQASQIQALDRIQPVLTMALPTSAKMTHDYVRHGTARRACPRPWTSPPARSWPSTTGATATRSSSTS